MKKITKEEFQERIGKDFEVIEFNGMSSYLKLKCKICSKEFDYLNANNFKGKCPCCNGFKKDQEEYIKKAKSIHGERYDYSLVNYVNNKTKIKIFCKRCNEWFEQRADVHLKSCGHKCYKKEILSKEQTLTTEEFIKKVEEKFPNKFGFDKTNYINTKTKTLFFCKNCKEYFEQKPAKILLGYGCNKCSLQRSIQNRKLSKEEFLKRCSNIHSNEYNYDLVNFNKTSDKINIKCNKCENYFFQSVASHLSGSGCPYCAKSKGEKELKKFLEEKGIAFIQNKTFDDLKDDRLLSYDFYIEEKNLLIEYNGIQHYSYNNYFYKNLHDWHRQLHHDWLKRKYATKNNINLLIIPYWKNIRQQLNAAFTS